MQLLVYSLLLMVAFISRVECERNTPRSTRASRNDAAVGFECPDEFGYYPHPHDCTQYYVCVFGGALLESCTGGLMYSHELQTCDWPRNVGCQNDGDLNPETEDEDPLLERSAKADSQRQQQHHHHQQQQQQQQQQQRQPAQRPQVHVTSPAPSITQITERQSRHRQQQQQQQTQRTYHDDEYEPATEFESDRQQRVYRGQPSTIGQVQRDRDGLRRNIISVSSTHLSHPASIITTPSSYGDDSVGHETNANSTTSSPTTTASTTSDQLRDTKDYTIHEATRSNYVVVSSPSPFKLPPKESYDDHLIEEHQSAIRITSSTPVIENTEERQLNKVPKAIVSPPAPRKLPILQQRIDHARTTHSISLNDEVEHNEIYASTPSTRKQTTYEFDDEPIGRGNYFTAPSTVRQRIKAKIAQRGRERYHGSNYVTMKVVRKRPIDRDQIGKDSFANDVTVPIRGTTQQTPTAVAVEKNVSTNSHETMKRVDRVDDAPTTLSPSMRAAILSQFQRDQEDVEKNEISAVSNTQQRNNQNRDKSDTSNDVITASSFPPALRSHVETIKLELATTPTPFRRVPTSTTPDEIEKNEITVTSLSTSKESLVNDAQSRPEINDSSNVVAGPVNSRQRQRDSSRRSSTLEREKESVVNSARTPTESHYRSIPSETSRTVKTTTSTPVISKAYYDPESYPYYTIYDDDVSIYKDDDYAQYTINQSVPIHHPPPQQQNVRIAEVTPNSKSYTQKPKKVAVNDADKYNFNSGVTVSDYDIYESQGHLNKNKFHINDGQQSYRTNSISPVIHVTTPNAIIDSYEPLTTTTQPPPTTTARPYTVTVQSRGRPQVNRGTAPPRSRPTLKPSTEIVSKAQEFIDIYRNPPVRPAPIYPTPVVDKPAAKCRRDVCLLPDCNCGGSDIPGDYLPEEIPQIVLLTFDDSVNDLNKVLYADLFEKGRKNPNGCPISATFYVSHEWTDYSQVQNLYATGHEIASHTVSHSFGEQFSARKWAREVAGQREILAAYGGVKLDDVRGMRAPFLSVGGNNMFKMLWETNFTYDSSMPIYENRPPSWPYTLDYKLFHDCMIPPCPTKSYPGLWEVPMVMWQDLNGGRCSMGDACSNPPTSDGVYKMLIKNFERHYTTNRAPFGLFYHAAWFTQPHHKEGFISFLDTIVAMDDVWVVTNWQALQWVRNPTPLGLLNNFEGFGCNYPDRPKRCNNSKLCNLWHKSGVRYMRTCQPCPEIYPWTGKTGIRSSRIDNDIEN